MNNSQDLVPARAEETSAADPDNPDKKPACPKRPPLLPPEALGPYRAVKVDDLKLPNPLIPTGRAMLVHVLGALALTAIFFLTDQGIARVAAGLLAAVLLAPFYRGLENLVHGAAHRDIAARGQLVRGVDIEFLNDLLGNLLCAIPVGQDVAGFRTLHLGDHHGRFDLDRDPCRARMLAHPDTREGRLPTMPATIRQLPTEIWAFYRTVGGAPWFTIRALGWHALVYIAPLALLAGVQQAALIWASIFLPLFLVTLPFVRAVAESSEHDYRPGSRGLSMVERTYSHDGWWNHVFHMYGDHLHPDHHLFPSIPQYRLWRVRERSIQTGLIRFMRFRYSPLGKTATYG